MDFSGTLFRCSSLGYLMTEPRAKKDKDAGNLSESAKTHLVDVFVSKKYGRNTDIHNKYIQKGLMVEEDSITLYSRLKKKFYKKNEERLFNKFIQGTPDLYEGESIYKATHIPDIKSSYDIFTFFRNHTSELSNLYYWQIQGYMDLTGAKSGSIVFCLVDTPEVIMNDEKRKLMWKMGVATSENPDYKLACDELDKLFLYGDIPIEEKVIEFFVERNQEDIDLMHEKVVRGRKYLEELNERIESLTLKRRGESA